MTESSILVPFFTGDAPDGQFNPRLRHPTPFHLILVSHTPSRPQSPSEGRSRRKGKGSTCMWPIPGAVIETWETDDKGESNIRCSSASSLLSGQPSYVSSSHARLLRHSLQGTPRTRLPSRLRMDEQDRYGNRAIIPVAYPIPGDVPVGSMFFPSLCCFTSFWATCHVLVFFRGTGEKQGPVGEVLLIVGRHNPRPCTWWWTPLDSTSSRRHRTQKATRNRVTSRPFGAK